MFSDEGVDLAAEEGVGVDAHGREVAAELEADETMKPGPCGDGTQELLDPAGGKAGFTSPVWSVSGTDHS